MPVGPPITVYNPTIDAGLRLTRHRGNGAREDDVSPQFARAMVGGMVGTLAGILAGTKLINAVEHWGGRVAAVAGVGALIGGGIAVGLGALFD